MEYVPAAVSALEVANEIEFPESEIKLMLGPPVTVIL